MPVIRKNLAVVMCFMLTSSLIGQTLELFNGIQLYQSLDEAKEKISLQGSKTSIYSIEQPSFPLAEKTETHILSRDYRTTRGKIAEVVFTFADDQLVYIQAYGNAIEVLTGHRKDSAQTYNDFAGYWKDLVITKPKEDKVWILTPEAAHPNLFTWDNPYLPVNKEKDRPLNPSIRVPDYLEMGASLEVLQPVLEGVSEFTYIQELDGDDPNAQLQIDCFGVPYAGFPRKFEARFGDGKLNMVWILTGKGEENRLRKLLVEEYGPALYVDEAWEAYDNWQLMLRKDKPEILLLTKTLAEFYRKDYFKQQ